MLKNVCFLTFVAAFTGFLCGLSATIILIIALAIVVLAYGVVFAGSFLLFPKDLEKDELCRIFANENGGTTANRESVVHRGPSIIIIKYS